MRALTFEIFGEVRDAFITPCGHVAADVFGSLFITFTSCNKCATLTRVDLLNHQQDKIRAA